MLSRLLNARHASRNIHSMNQLKIPILEEKLRSKLFGEYKTCGSDAMHEVLNNLNQHGINIDNYAKVEIEENIDLISFLGNNVEEHLESISKSLVDPYVSLCEKINDPPSLPLEWSFTSGWTKYSGSEMIKVDFPDDDLLFFDTEVLVKDGSMPTMAIALGNKCWYSWTSTQVINNSYDEFSSSLDNYIPLGLSLNNRLVVGHFISYDRARIKEEYFPELSKTRFLDTMSLHISLSGLTSTQKYLKSSASKSNFSNKVWKDFVDRHQQSLTTEESTEKEDYSNLDWISKTSMNNLLDVYEFHCKKPAIQTKESREIFVKGSLVDVRENFQNLMTYCANDVQMTQEIFRVVFPKFRKNFPHNATLFGLLEMSKMYLPINKSWFDFIKSCESVYSKINLDQKNILKELAQKNLENYGKNDLYKNDPWLWDLDWTTPRKPTKKNNIPDAYYESPKWYRDLVKKPVKDNLLKGPTEISTQMRIAVKLLRLCWKGLPLHYDQQHKWSLLIPGKLPEPYGDPLYYLANNSMSDNHLDAEYILKDIIPATKSDATGEKTVDFPYKTYLNYWTSFIENKLEKDLESFTNDPDRVKLNDDDCIVLGHLSEFLSAIPAEKDEISRIRKTLLKLKEFTNSLRRPDSPTRSPKVMKMDLRQLLPHIQVQSSEHWHDQKKYQSSPNSSPNSSPKSKKTSSASQINEPINPMIKCFWLSKLPHPDGYENSVGNPLSKSFQIYITNGNLHADHSDEKLQSLAEKLLSEKIQCSFWQSYSTRIRDQLVLWVNRPDEKSPGFGAILPQVITAGTVSRRAVEPLWLTASNVEGERVGSEVKALIQTSYMTDGNSKDPEGNFVFVGADVDSQELWIAGLIGDAKYSIQGSTPFSWMMLQGEKSQGTDLHSKLAQDHKISRDSAKVLNYARLYGAGLDFTETLLKRFCLNMTDEQANRKAHSILAATKGKKARIGPEKGTWSGGTESVVFNEMEKIARSDQPKTPFLNASITESLNPASVKNDFMPSRVNWVVQSSAVDYLHVMLVNIRWLCQVSAEKLHYTPRLALSIHDEFRYIVHKDDALLFGYLLQISNLITRSFFVHRLGMRDLPKSVAFFSSIEIDHCLRKSPDNDCVTPSNPQGLSSTYNVPRGRELRFDQLIEEMKNNSIYPFDKSS